MINEVNGVNSDIDKLSNEDLVKIIKKYNINTGNQNLNRSQALQLIKNFIESKQKKKNEVKSISVVHITFTNVDIRINEAEMPFSLLGSWNMQAGFPLPINRPKHQSSGYSKKFDPLSRLKGSL